MAAPYREPICDPKTGQVSPNWLTYFVDLEAATSSAGSSATTGSAAATTSSTSAASRSTNAADLTGDTLAAGVVNSSLARVGTLTGGRTGVGFVIDLNASTVIGMTGMLSNLTANLIPATTDTYDIGSSSRLWRQAYIGQINAVLFAKETQSLYGGWLAVTKNAGTFAANVAAADASVDFGQAMTLNQFVLVRAADAGGTITSEYMQVGAVVSGTRYTVTRNLSGLGLKAWMAGTAYAVRGVAGDGWIEMNAFDTPRMSVFSQGALYNNSTENIRIGYLAGMPNGSTGIGMYMGDATNYVRWDGTSLKVVGSDATLDNSGLTLGSNTSFGYLSGAALKFRRASSSGYGTGTGDIFSAYSSSVNGGGSFQIDTLTIENTMVTPNNGGGFTPNYGRALVSLIAKGWSAVGAGSAQPTASIDLDSGPAGAATSAASIAATTITLTGAINLTGAVVPSSTINASNGLQLAGKQTLASGATYDFPGGSAPRGALMIIVEEDTAAVQVLLRGGSGTTVLMQDPVGIASIAVGTAAKINVYWNAGSGTYRIQNNRGAQRTLELIMLGTGIL